LDLLQEKREALRRIEDGLKSPAIPPIHREPLPIDGLQKGDEVEILPFGQRGILLEDPSIEARRSVKVQAGSVELTIDRKHLSGIDRAPDEGRGSEEDGVKKDFVIEVPETEGISSEIDIRGMTSEEALEEIQKYLDRARLSRFKEAKIVHGHGTGVLKKAVREYLCSSPYAVKFASGSPQDGGDGVTIVILREG